MTYREVMQLPLVAFWSANRQVDRLAAVRDQRSLQVAIAATDPQAAKDMFEGLRLELDSPSVTIKGFDEEQFLHLKGKHGKGDDGGS